MEIIQAEFDAFWAIGDYNLQNAYLSKLIIIEDFKRCYDEKDLKILKRFKRF